MSSVFANFGIGTGLKEAKGNEMECTLEMFGFYKKIFINNPGRIIVTPVIAPLLPVLLRLTGEETIPELPRFMEMVFERDDEVPTLYKFKGLREHT